jgi:hypothetical protein
MEMVESVYGEKTLKKMAIFSIIKKVKNRENTDDQHHLNSRKLSKPWLSLPLSMLPLRKTAG